MPALLLESKARKSELLNNDVITTSKACCTRVWPCTSWLPISRRLNLLLKMGSKFKSVFLLIRDMVECCNRRFGCETIHSAQKFTSMNLLQLSCVITWAWSFLTSEVVEAVRGQKRHFLAHTLALLLNTRFIPQCQFYQIFTKKWDQLWPSASFQPSYLEILEPSPQGLISSYQYVY